MPKWKPWQRFAYLGFLLVLNLIIFSALTVLVVNTYRRARLRPAVEIAAVPPPDSLAVFSTITPEPQILQPAAPTPVPSLNIPPAPIPTQTGGATTLVTPQTITLVEGSRSQPRIATPTSTPTLTPQPSATSTSTPTPQPSATATHTPTPQPSATPTSTPTPLPSATATHTPTPQPSATPTSTPTPRPTATPTRTHTPSPTVTNTPRPTNTSTRTPQPTVAPSNTPTLTPQASATLPQTPTQIARLKATATHISPPGYQPTATTRRVVAELSSLKATLAPPVIRTAQPSATPTVFPTLTPTMTATPRPTNSPSPTAPPTLNPTPVVVAAALKSESANLSLDLPSGRLVQPDESAANTAGLVKAIPLTNASIALSWIPAGKTVQYRIYSDMGSGYGVYIHKADVHEPAFVDDMLQPGKTYSYRVTGWEANREIVLAQTQSATFGSQVAAGKGLASQRPVLTATIAPAPTALPADAILLGLLSDNSFTDEFNTLNIVGEVRNDSNLDVGHTDIAVTFYDTAGTVIGTANGETILKVIPPGEVSPFLITLSRPPGIGSYSLRAVARPVASELNAQLSVIQVKRYEDDAGFFHIQGVIENTGRVAAKRTKVVAVIYGRGGSVINVGFTYTNPPALAPGERARYEVIFTYFPKYVDQRVIPFEE